MPFYIRKSVSAGPFRFNFSNGGLGVSVGVKGFRVGTGPRGHYVHAGRGGIYYRASIGRAGETKSAAMPRVRPPPQPPTFVEPGGVQMVEVESGDVHEMRDEAFRDLLDDINSKRQQFSVAVIVACCAIAIALLTYYLLGAASGAVMLLLVPVAWGFGRWIDSYRRTSVLFYELDSAVEHAYQMVVERFDDISRCEGKWHVEAGGAVRDLTTWKRNAGATHLIRKKVTALNYRLPNIVKSNITPPAIGVGRQVLYFFPDVMLIDDGRRVGAVGYGDLRVVWQHANFIEDGRVPRDAQAVGNTWKYPNKKGGPDRRFNTNYQIPVCLYEAMHLTSASGLNELLEFSRLGVCEPFITAVKSLPPQMGISTPLAIGAA